MDSYLNIINLVHEAINYGNVGPLIDSGQIKSLDVLIAILEKSTEKRELDIKTRLRYSIAYRIVCTRLLPNQQYIKMVYPQKEEIGQNKEFFIHFLVFLSKITHEKQKLLLNLIGAIFVLSNGSIECKTYRYNVDYININQPDHVNTYLDDMLKKEKKANIEKLFSINEEKKVSKYLLSPLTSIAKDVNFEKIVKVICNIKIPYTINPTLADRIALAESTYFYHIITNLPAKARFEAFLEADNFTMLKNLEFDDKPTCIITRSNHLFKNAKNYWNQYACDKYQTFFSQLMMNTLSLSKKEIKIIHELWPSLLPLSSQSWSSLAQIIFWKGPELSCYYLGLPFEYGHIDKELIVSRLDLLSEIGPEEYVKKYSSLEEDPHYSYLIKLSNSTDGIIKWPCRNQEDVLSETITSYAPFDRLIYLDGKNVYRFSRTEFENLIETKKNPWTNEKIAPSFLDMVSLRIKIGQRLKLVNKETVSWLETLKILDTTSNKTDRTSSNNVPRRPNRLIRIPNDSYLDEQSSPNPLFSRTENTLNRANSNLFNSDSDDDSDDEEFIMELDDEDEDIEEDDDDEQNIIDGMIRSINNTESRGEAIQSLFRAMMDPNAEVSVSRLGASSPRRETSTQNNDVTQMLQNYLQTTLGNSSRSNNTPNISNLFFFSEHVPNENEEDDEDP